MADPDDLARAVATLRRLVERSGALRGIVLLDRGKAVEPAVVDCDTGGEAEVVVGEAARPWPPDDAEPLALPDHVRPFPPLEVDLEEQTVQSPLGVLDHAGRIVRDSAAVLPGRSVLTLAFASTVEDAPVFLTARAGEALVLTLGDAEYELPPGWPGEPGAAAAPGPLGI